MAHMIPGMELKEEFNDSHGEWKLYDLLQKLPDDYYVFHSTRWNEKRRKNELSRKQYVEWGEADFTIFHPRYGIIVFEVKDGLISLSREQGWIQQNRATGAQKIIDPMTQAEKSKYFFLEKLQSHFGGSSPYTLCSAVWFTSGDKHNIEGRLPDNYKDETVLWLNDLESVESIERAILRVYRYYDTRQVDADETLINQILNILAPEFGCFQGIRSKAMASRTMFDRYTREQAYLLDYLDEQEEAAIHGIAGTGKTVLAVQKAQRLAHDAPVLFLCFNRFLKEHLQKVYKGIENISFYTIDGLYVSKEGPTSPLQNENRDDLISEFLLSWESYNFPYKHIIIDEGQDFRDEHLQALHLIAESQGGCFYVFYDRNQFIQGLEYPKWLDEMECRLVLSRNCRNTKEIAVTSTRPIGIKEEKIKLRGELENSFLGVGNKPNLFFVKDIATLKEYLLKLIIKYTAAGYKRENIVVLSAKGAGKSALQPVDYALNNHYILSESREPDKILFTTIRKFKGLESDVIICVDIDETTFQSDIERSLFYVGTSRATTYLDLLTLSERTEIASALNDRTIVTSALKSAQIIRDKLQVRIGTEEDLVGT